MFHGIEAEFGGFSGCLEIGPFGHADDPEVVGQRDIDDTMTYHAAVALDAGSLESG